MLKLLQILLAWALAGAGFVGSALAQSPLPVPPLSGRVIDQTATLNAAQAGALEAKLAAFEEQAGTQIVMLLVASTQPEDIADFTQRVGDAWKLGRREVGDGVLIVVAKDDRGMRIAVAKTLEGAIPDLAARQIMDRAMQPAFRNNDYAGGLMLAADHLFARIRGEALPVPTAQSKRAPAGGLNFESLAMLVFFGVPVLGSLLTRAFGRRFGSVLTAGAAGGVGWWLSASLLLGAGAALATVILVGVFGVGSASSGLLGALGGGRHRGGRGGWGGGGGFGGGGGGFSSGGGGNFGGGGASGSW